MIEFNHRLFKSRSNMGYLASGHANLDSSEEKIAGYILGLETAAAACRSHIVSAAVKFGEKSEGVRIGRADLCCIEREIRRARANSTQRQSTCSQ